MVWFLRARERSTKSSTNPMTRRRPAVGLGARGGPHRIRNRILSKASRRLPRCLAGHPALHALGIELVVPARYSELVKYTRLPSRLISTICGPPASGFEGCGCGVRRAMPPMCTEPTSLVERIADVVLTHLAGSPARHVQIFIVEREVDVSDQWRHRRERFEHSGSCSGSAGSAGISITFFIVPLAVARDTKPNRRSTDL